MTNTTTGRIAQGTGAAIATGHPLAAHAARAMLQAGGSAIDAAIAADAVMGVVEPMATSIGGDLLAMIVLPDGEAISYNGTGRAPAGLTADRVAMLPGERIPERHALAVTTPGAVRGWYDLHQRYGRLEWAALFQPAIRAAAEGFEVAPVAAREWKIFDSVLHADPHCAELFRAGNPPLAGQRYANPALADVLTGIAQHGPAHFYTGALAQTIAKAVQDRGGELSVGDLADHTGQFCTPVATDFQGVRVHQCPPNTHGVAVLHALDAIDALDGTECIDGIETEADDATRLAATLALIHATAQAMAHAQRTVADPAGNTVCSVIVDRSGLAVTLMSSIFKRFGSAIVPRGCGFALQNRGFGFSGPGHINSPGPRKRPYHTVVPGACTKDGHFLMGMGVVGGLMQPQGQIQLLTRILACGQSPGDAIGAPRWRLEPHNTLALEEGMPEFLVAGLRAAGYAAPAATTGELAGRSDFGGAQLVIAQGPGRYMAVSDPRKDGIACIVS